MNQYIEIILPLAFEDDTFTYLFSDGIEVGMQVVVPFRGKKVIGVVVEIHNREVGFKVKPVDEIVDKQVLMVSKQIDFVNWVGKYYLTPTGYIYKQIIPKQVRNLTYKAPTLVGFEIVNTDLKRVEELIKKYKAAKKALSVLLALGEGERVSKKQLVENGATEVGLKKLVELKIVDKVEVPLKIYSKCLENSNQDSSDVSIAKLCIGVSFEQNVEIVKQKIAQANSQNQICLVLAPNNFYAQLIVEKLDDPALVAFHAKCSLKNRSENYLRLLKFPESVKAVVGTKNALFLPFDKLGQIVVIEESSYAHKSDVSPRLNVRDCAIVLAEMFKAQLTLTAVVPSVESYANFKMGRFELVDMRNSTASVKILEKGKGTLFSKYMLKRIAETVDQGKQVLVFQNRRGFAGSVECLKCGFTPVCPECNVTMVLHQSQNRFMCHHCDFWLSTFVRCPKCNSTEIQYNGMGTERVEQQLKSIFANLKIARVDSDTVARVDAFGEIKEDIESAKSDIIVATQVVFNGLKIPNLDLAVVVNADNLTVSTDFRTSEKIVSTLEHLKYIVKNEVIIQANNSQNPTFMVVKDDYLNFFDKELEQRANHNYPPFSRLLTVRMSGFDNRLLQKVALELENTLIPIFKNLLNPVYEPIGDRKIAGEFVLEIMVKLQRNAKLVEFKTTINSIVRKFSQKYSKIKFSIDVDPMM